MIDMPTSCVTWYRQWIAAFPQTWHPNDMERFYMFLWVLFRNSKKIRTRHWLDDNLTQDCKGKLLKRDIRKYCDMFEIIQNFYCVWKSQQAKLYAREIYETALERSRQRLAESLLV